MVQFRFCLVFAALCVSYSFGAITLPPTEIIPVQPSIATEAPKPDHTTTTTLAPTTTSTTTTTTTTPAPTTTSTTTTTTTTTPPPPPPAPTPTPPAPTPAGPPEQGSWNYTSDANVTCVVVQFAAQLNVSYTKLITENETATVYQTLNVPAKASVAGGNCTGAEQLIIITWPVDTIDNMLNLTYLRNDTTHTYSLKAVDVVLAAYNFPNASSNASVELHHGAEWSTPLATSYRCQSSTRLNMTSNTSAATLTFSKLQEEAFRSAKEAGFSAPRDCGGGDVPDAVPIAVGCALGGLVVVVLVAYLVGRRRSVRGYLSM